MQPRRPAIGIFTAYTGNYYFGTMLSSIHRVARRAGVPLIVVRSELRTIEIPAVGSEHVGGWIVIHPGEADTVNLAALVATGVPVVTISHVPSDVACVSVIGDDRGDTRALVHHLIDHGHRRIAYIDQGTDRWSRDRYQGYLDALHERGIAYDPSLVVDTEQALADIGDAGGLQHMVRRGEFAAQQLIARGMPCTALVASVDHSAIAAMRVLQAAGYRTFWFDLSVPVTTEALELNLPSGQPVIGYAGPRRTILVVDDSAYNRAFLVDLLTPLGFTLVEAADGEAALTQVRALRPDALLMDLLMPGMSGMAVTQAIRQTEDRRDVVIIATSASVFNTDRQQSLLAGCHAFLPKPIHVEQLLELLATQLGLTWHYAEGKWPDPAQPDGADTATFVPPPAELARLFELAEIGDILGLQARAAYLEQQNPQLRPFAQHLGRLAGRFELEQALALIARYLQPEQ